MPLPDMYNASKPQYSFCLSRGKTDWVYSVVDAWQKNAILLPPRLVEAEEGLYFFCKEEKRKRFGYGHTLLPPTLRVPELPGRPDSVAAFITVLNGSAFTSRFVAWNCTTTPRIDLELDSSVDAVPRILAAQIPSAISPFFWFFFLRVAVQRKSWAIPSFTCLPAKSPLTRLPYFQKHSCLDNLKSHQIIQGHQTTGYRNVRYLRISYFYSLHLLFAKQIQNSVKLDFLLLLLLLLLLRQQKVITNNNGQGNQVSLQLGINLDQLLQRSVHSCMIGAGNACARAREQATDRHSKRKEA